MQWHRTYWLAVAWGVLSDHHHNGGRTSANAFAFAPSSSSSSMKGHKSISTTSFGVTRSFQPTTSATTLHIGGMGWDNENFLEALSQGDDALRKANQEYEALSRFGRRPVFNQGEEDDAASPTPTSSSNSPDELPTTDMEGAILTEEMKAQIKASNEQLPDGSQGGQLFREMLARAQKGGTLSSSIVPPPPPPPVVTPAIIPPTTNLDSLTVEQQAELFRQMMAAQQQQQQPQVAPPPMINPQSLPRRTSGGDERREGRNRDADAIVNSSDVYFAQLKLDSTIRNYARYSGDNTKANQVFADPSIQQIKAHVNPYLRDMQQKEASMLETAPDEMLILPTDEDSTSHASKEKSYAGISYKEKLQQQRKQQQGKMPPTTTVSEPSTKPPSTAAVDATTSLPSPTPGTQATTMQQQPQQPQQVSSSSSLQSSSVASSSSSTVNPLTNEIDPEAFRKDLRTFMGLLLKHRGGAGFGAGRLQQDTDIEAFEQLAQRIMAQLNNEVAHTVSSSSSSATTTPTAPTTQQVATSTPSNADAPTGTDASRVQNMITCIEGGIQMYRNSPLELREGVLITFRAALVAAVKTVSEILEPTGQPVLPTTTTPSSTSDSDHEQRVNAAIGLMEGAIVMYKNSPPELQLSILVTLRAALVSAIGTLNGIIATNEVANYQAYQSQQQRDTSVTTPPPPLEKKEKEGLGTFYDVVPSSSVVQDEESASASSPTSTTTLSSPTGNDDNSKFFDQLHTKLEQAKGSGAMGLNTDLKSDFAEELAKDLAKMRALLVQELQDGIPTAAVDAESSTDTDEAKASASSRYQEMLAKARGDKESSS